MPCPRWILPSFLIVVLAFLPAVAHPRSQSYWFLTREEPGTIEGKVLISFSDLVGGISPASVRGGHERLPSAPSSKEISNFLSENLAIEADGESILGEVVKVSWPESAFAEILLIYTAPSDISTLTIASNLAVAIRHPHQTLCHLQGFGSAEDFLLDTLTTSRTVVVEGWWLTTLGRLLCEGVSYSSATFVLMVFVVALAMLGGSPQALLLRGLSFVAGQTLACLFFLHVPSPFPESFVLASDALSLCYIASESLLFPAFTLGSGWILLLGSIYGLGLGPQVSSALAELTGGPLQIGAFLFGFFAVQLLLGGVVWSVLSYVKGDHRGLNRMMKGVWTLILLAGVASVTLQFL